MRTLPPVTRIPLRRRSAPIALVLASFAGCFAGAVGMGNEFTWDQVDSLRIGMTQQEVIAAMGSRPSAVKKTDEDGHTREELGWVDMDTFKYKSVGAIFVDGKLAEITRSIGP